MSVGASPLPVRALQARRCSVRWFWATAAVFLVELGVFLVWRHVAVVDAALHVVGQVWLVPAFQGVRCLAWSRGFVARDREGA